MIDIESLTIGELRRIAAIASALTPVSAPTPAAQPSPLSAYYGLRCIIRCRDAGVHYGTVEHIEGRTVILRDARRIWRWRGALTLSHLATEGTPLAADYTRIAPMVASMPLLDAAEVLPITDAAAARLDAIADWVQA